MLYHHGHAGLPVASGLSAVARAVVDVTQAAAVLLCRDDDRQ
jgi:hypothetical protein